MDIHKYKRVGTLPQRKIDSLLMKQYPEDREDPKRNTQIATLRLGIRNEIRAAKKAQRIDKIKSAHHKRLWANILRDLGYEENNVRQGMKYASVGQHPERLTAFEQYGKVIAHVRTVIEAARYSEITAKNRQGEKREVRNPTPTEYVHWHNAEGKKHIPNNGCHWTDWVPSHIRERIVVLFDAIPTTQRSKRKIPFQRMQRPRTVVKKNKAGEVVAVIHNPALTTLIKRTEKEYALALQEYEIAPTDPDREREVTLMRQALARMAKMKPNEAVPHTWHGLFKFGRSKC